MQKTTQKNLLLEILQKNRRIKTTQKIRTKIRLKKRIKIQQKIIVKII